MAKKNKNQTYELSKKGYIYILSNPSFKKNIYKIGFTNRGNYHTRINELNNSTSIPLPFKIIGIYKTKNPPKMEIRIHTRLKRYRINNRREFFKVRLFIIKIVIWFSLKVK